MQICSPYFVSACRRVIVRVPMKNRAGGFAIGDQSARTFSVCNPVGGRTMGAALAFVLVIGKAERFQCGKQVASYLGLIPLEDSSGNQRRLGHITKQGSSMLRFLLVEAAQVTVRSLPEWHRKYAHLMMRRGRKTAKVAMARRLAIRLYWMWREGQDYEQQKKFGSHAGQPGHRDGVRSNIE